MKKNLICLVFSVLSFASFAAEQFIVKDGKSNAQIVIAAENRPRSATLAALELRKWIEKISGARLPIVTSPDASVPVKIYVGKSSETDKLGVKSDDLKYGAFRVVSGPDWLVLLGDDKDFVPSKLTTLKRSDSAPLEEWKRITAGKTDGAWSFHRVASFKGYWNPGNFDKIFDDYYGKGSSELWRTGGNSINGFWDSDSAGSVSAVSEFLYSLGVRFYMPDDEMGTVVPKLSSVPLQSFNKTLIPDFPCRLWLWYGYCSFPLQEVLWARRLGINDGVGYYAGAHGLVFVHSAPEMKKAHPEYYAIDMDGKRKFEHRGGEHGVPCFSSPGFIQETANYCRFRFDVLGDKMVSIMPVDGLIQCQCDGCKGKTFSEMVWGFVNQVATELYKTHPDKLVNCGAYGQYRQAPDSIEKYSPNVMATIYNYQRAGFMDPDIWKEYQYQFEKWRSRLAPQRICRGENNLYNAGASGLKRQLISYPIIFPRAVARDLKYLKGISFGDGAESPQLSGMWKSPGVDHLALYVQASFLMDADQDIEKVLDEYYALFYGPAANDMKIAFTYAEDNMASKDKSMGGGRAAFQNVSLDKKLRIRELLENARKSAGDGIYGQRVARIISELKSKDDIIREEEKLALNSKRFSTPLVTSGMGPILETSKQYKLLDLEKKDVPVELSTTFKVGWDKKDLLFEIVCKEPDMNNLTVADQVNKGDYLAIALETPLYPSYYIIYIGPDGKLLEGNPVFETWASLAEVKVEKGPDSWRVKLRIPTVDSTEIAADPNHRVLGEKPTINNLWYFNVARQRVRNGKTETQVFSITNRSVWNSMESFAKLEIR